MMTTPIFPSIHDYGIFYNGPIGAVKREYQANFRADYGLAEDDMETRIVADLDVFEDERDVEYDHTDSYMWEDLKKDIFHKPYSHYLEYSTCVNWQNHEGYRFRTFQNALEYSYECSMDYLARSKNFRYHQFSMSSHDVFGASHYYIGLTDKEYDWLENQELQTVLQWAKERIETVSWIREW